MPSNAQLLVVLSALLHDVGKLFERGNLFPEAAASAAPGETGGESLRHRHAAYTRAFCDWLAEGFTCLKDAGEEWKRACAGHHGEGKAELATEVVRLANWLSIGEREIGTCEGDGLSRRTRLEPVLERIHLDGYPEGPERLATRHRYPLRALSAERESHFPQPPEAMGLSAMEGAEGAVSPRRNWNHLLAAEDLTPEYQKLAEGFKDEVSVLAKNHSNLSLADLIVTLMTLLERHTANVPSSAHLRHPDISLYDHLRSTAAIAQALWVQCRETGISPGDLDLQDETVFPWRLVCGDFSGIQSFIYNLTNRGAAKGLRGRSFFVSHYCRLCADFLLKELGLHRAAVLYNSGGKFYLLMPANREDSLKKARNAVNRALLERFDAAVFFGLGVAPVSAPMFAQGRMSEAWQTAVRKLDQDRTRRFQKLMDPAFFAPREDVNPARSCAACGSMVMDQAEKVKCWICESLEGLGRDLKNADAILTVWAEDQATSLKNRLNLRAAYNELGATVFLVSSDKFGEMAGMALPKADCLLLNRLADQPFKGLGIPSCGISLQYIGRWDPKRQTKEDDEPWDFDDYAANAGGGTDRPGIARLGVLRMDVDNLGLVFVQGLRFPARGDNAEGHPGWGDVIRENGQVRRKSMASMSRMATLSRQLNHFFTAHVPRLLDKSGSADANQPSFDRCQVIYAGGDDLFIIGSWDQLPELARTIRDDFRTFCCGNPVFSISGGITLQRGKYPIYKGAQWAGEAESAAKTLRTQWDGVRIAISEARGPLSAYPNQKDGFTFLGVPILWEDFEAARNLRDSLGADMAGDRGLLGYLARTAATNHLAVRDNMRRRGMEMAAAWNEIAFASWRWRTAYQLRRRYKTDQAAIRRWSDILFANNVAGEESALPVYTWMEMPVRWIDFLHRRKGGK